MLDVRRAVWLMFKMFKFATPVLFSYVFKRGTNAINYAEPLRLALEDMGLTYLKLGQYLAMRFDLLPASVCDELSKLFEHVGPITFEEAKKVIEAELGRPLDQAFSEFNEEHLAAGSVAQVHRARTLDGTRVVVKIQRPGIEPILASDMRILGFMADVSDRLKLTGNLLVKDVINEFSFWTWRELDFVSEGEVADRLRASATSHEVVPLVHWDLTTRKVITLDFIEGTSIAEIAKKLDEQGMAQVLKEMPDLDIEEALHNMVRASLHQLFVMGFFHGDPHPGNILILKDNAVSFVDFGIFGELSEYQRELLTNYIESLALGNVVTSFRYYASLAAPSQETNMREFEKQGVEILSRWYHASQDPNTPIADRHLGRVSGEITSVMRRNGVLIGTETLLFWRAISALDSTALRLSKTYDWLDELGRFFKELRPGFGERMIELTTNRGRLMTLAQLSAGINGQLTGILNRLEEHDYDGTLSVDDSCDVQRSERRRTKVLAAAITALSFVILAINPGLMPWVRQSSSVAAAVIFILIVATQYRR